MYTIANLPAVQRDLFLSRVVRCEKDSPVAVDTLRVEWADMTVAFATDAAVSECAVDVAEGISLVAFTRRMESLLDCGAQSESAEWILKFSCRMSDYGSADAVRRLLCDKIASLDSASGETVGVMKIKRRSVQAGYAKVRLVPAEDSIQLIVRHSTAQGLKAVWKSVLWRLRPQYPTAPAAAETDGTAVVNTNASAVSAPVAVGPNGAWRVVMAPCVQVVSLKKAPGGKKAPAPTGRRAARSRSRNNGGGGEDGCFGQKAAWLSQQGMTVDLSKSINVSFPVAQFAGNDLPYGTAVFYCKVEVKKLPAGLPQNIWITGGVVEMSTPDWSDFAEKAKALSQWLGLGWTL